METSPFADSSSAARGCELASEAALLGCAPSRTGPEELTIAAAASNQMNPWRCSLLKAAGIRRCCPARKRRHRMPRVIARTAEPKAGLAVGPAGASRPTSVEGRCETRDHQPLRPLSANRASPASRPACWWAASAANARAGLRSQSAREREPAAMLRRARARALLTALSPQSCFNIRASQSTRAGRVSPARSRLRAVRAANNGYAEGGNHY